MSIPRYHQRGFHYRPSGQYIYNAALVSSKDAKNDQVRIWGRWTDTGVPGLGRVDGQGFTVTRDNVGIWTVTFDQGFQFLQSGSAFVQNNASGAGVDLVGQVGPFTAGAAGACTLVIYAFDSAGAQDLAAGDYMCFEAVLTSQWLD